MRQFLQQMFSENGAVSEMRVLSLLSLLAGIGIAFYGMNKPAPDYSGISLLAGLFVGAAFGGKVAQKSIEQKGKTTLDQSND